MIKLVCHTVATHFERMSKRTAWSAQFLLKTCEGKVLNHLRAATC